MAFDFRWLALCQQTQVLDPTHNSSVGVVGNPVPKSYTYNAALNGANDTTAATQAANYFINAFAFLNVGDVIYVSSNNPGFHFVAVTASAVGGVTVAQIA